MNIKILIADDYKMMRDDLCSLLEGQKNMDPVVGEVENGLKAICLAQKLHPDVPELHHRGNLDVLIFRQLESDPGGDFIHRLPFTVYLIGRKIRVRVSQGDGNHEPLGVWNPGQFPCHIWIQHALIFNAGS